MSFLYATMKKIATLFSLFVVLFCCGCLQAQKIKFSKYFEDATLRINYLRVGNRLMDTIKVLSDDYCGQWSGSLTQLNDPFDNGYFRIVVKDAESGKRIYSRGFNSLFAEYRDTPEGRYVVGSFEEVVRIPWPKRPVLICWEERGEDQHYHTQHVLRYSPKMQYAQVLAQSCLEAESSKLVRLQYKGDIHKKIDVVIVPEGYGPADTVKMLYDMKKFCEYLLGQNPFKKHRNDFNVWGISATGESAGITQPSEGIWVNSLVGASYGTFGAERYLMTQQIFRLHDAIGWAPCDHIIIMANSNTYGGGGIYNFYAMSSLNSMANMILPHELGHSIGGLADEYVDEDLSYGNAHSNVFEPMEPNITSLVEFDRKWKGMLPAGTSIPTPENESVFRKENGPVGVYEGAGYQAKGLYRPVMHCMMRDYAPFCPVCTKRLEEVFCLYTR